MRSLLSVPLRYVCMQKTQSDLDGEFGVMREFSRGSHLRSVEQLIII